ncbi:MAG: hypothetical protein E6G41_09245 [Actinobacteria bacterium]|nr:MAG: hypothetical protein E6G41_09245 [Actinomycetota bacterium]
MAGRRSPAAPRATRSIRPSPRARGRAAPSPRSSSSPCSSAPRRWWAASSRRRSSTSSITPAARWASSERRVVGDRSFDVVAAHAHGIRAIGVLWGIGSESELRDAGADAIARSPAELVALLA